MSQYRPPAQALLVSKELNYDILKLIGYRAETWFEMGFNNYKLSRNPHLMDNLGYRPSFGIRTVQCIENANRIRETHYSKAQLTDKDWFVSRHKSRVEDYIATKYILCIYV